MSRGALLALVLVCAFAAVAFADGPDAYAHALRLYEGGDAREAASLLEMFVDEPGASAARNAAMHALLGWCRLRLDEYDAATQAFRAAGRIDPSSAEAPTGLGYIALRQGRTEDALAAFDRALTLDGAGADAWKGRGLALERSGDGEGAVDAFRRAVEANPADDEAQTMLRRARSRAQVEVERRPRGPIDPTDPVAPPDVPVRARAGRFEIRDGGAWRPFFVKGVNLGTGLPGLYPSEFPDDYDLYLRWFRQMSEMGANVVRLYTLHPPSLYRALRAHNLERPRRKLWLVQGVWAVLPPEHDFDDSRYVANLHDEIRRVIDAVYGNLELPARPGSAHGVYDTDLSADLLAYVLGREWEPYAVDRYQRRFDAPVRFRGRFVRTGRVQPMEAWLASICDVAAAHETDHYGRQHPLAFASWPTLDPLRHPTESTALEEVVLQGEQVTDEMRRREFYDEDRVDIDATSMRATGRFEAGLFASYHVYPYYPDFMLLEPGYAAARDDEGVSRYLGYLRALREHHGDQPVLIAEFGVPTSRGVSHLQPEGQHHGGHDGRRQGEIELRLLRNIRDAGMAGGIVFAWVDEWWKRNWMVATRYAPPERNRLWFNVMDPEQTFGLIAARPGADGWKVVLDGRDDDWAPGDDLYTTPERQGSSGAALTRFAATQDEGYLYLLIEAGLPGAETAAGMQYWIGIDTYDAARGDRRFPPPLDVTASIGMEYLVRIDSPENARLLIDPPYRIGSGEEGRPGRSEPNDDGEFVAIVTSPNRERWGRDGTRYPPRTYDLSPLRFGSTDPASARHDSQADWFASEDGRVVELRLPWAMLNVTDPSSHQVVHEEARTSGTVETTVTEGFRFHVLLLQESEEGELQVVDRYPRRESSAPGDYPLFRWPGWERPTYHLAPKESYHLFREKLGDF